MKISIETTVDQKQQVVIDHFNQELFKALNPPWVKADLVRYDGNKPGDTVALKLDFLIFKQNWISEITAEHQDEQSYYFIDEGKKLPFFLSYWKHKHIIEKKGEQQSIIRDDIEFKAPFGLLSLLLYPALYLQFAYRKPIYKKFFQALEKGKTSKA